MPFFTVKLGNGSDSGVVQIYNHVTDNWEEVCAENWNDTFGEIVCQQLGYRWALQRLNEIIISNKSLTEKPTRCKKSLSDRGCSFP